MLHLGGREEGKARTWPNRKQSTHMHLLMHARMHTHTCVRKGAHAPTHSHPHAHKQTHATQLHSPLEGAVYNPQLYCCHTLVHYHAQQSISKVCALTSHACHLGASPSTSLQALSHLRLLVGARQQFGCDKGKQPLQLRCSCSCHHQIDVTADGVLFTIKSSIKSAI